MKGVKKFVVTIRKPFAKSAACGRRVAPFFMTELSKRLDQSDPKKREHAAAPITGDLGTGSTHFSPLSYHYYRLMVCTSSLAGRVVPTARIRAERH